MFQKIPRGDWFRYIRKVAPEIEEHEALMIFDALDMFRLGEVTLRDLSIGL